MVDLDNSKLIDDSIAFSQIPQIIHPSQNMHSHCLEYEELALTRQTGIKRDSGKYMKLGNYYIKKQSVNCNNSQITQNNQNYQNSNTKSISGVNLNDSSINLHNDYIQTCDRNFINNPQYVVEYIREIFEYLLENEVSISISLSINFNLRD